MPTNDIVNALRRQPFVPFRLVFADGQEHEVRHPEMILVGVNTVTIGAPDPDRPHVYSRVDIIDARHIVRLSADIPVHGQG